MKRLRLPAGLSILAWSLIIAVTALSAVSFLTERVEYGLEQQGASTLAADLVVEYGRPIESAWIDKAQQLGLTTSRLVTFPSVIFAKGKPRLVQVKAVDANYPLRGTLKLRTQQGASTQAPSPGNAAVAQKLFDQLDSAPGEISLPFGKLQLLAQAVVIEEPDTGGNIFQLAPRVLVSYQDAENSDLLGPASRARYRLLLAGERKNVAAFRDWIKPQLPPMAELQTIENGRPELKSAIERARRFLGLAALVTSLLAGVGIWLATRHYVTQLYDQAAILRTLGMTSGAVLWRFTRQLLVLTLGAALLGLLGGLITQAILAELLGDLFNQALPPPSWRTLPISLAHALILVGGFALPTLLGLGRVPPLRVLRRELQPPGLAQWLSMLFAAGAFYLLLQWQADDTRLAIAMALGLSAMIAVFIGTALLLLKLFSAVKNASSLGLAALTRHKQLALVQLTGYGLSITLLLLLAVVRVDLLDTWQQSLPAETPNHFLVNIQPNEMTPIRERLAAHQVSGSGFFETTRGRLQAINGQAVNPEQYQSHRARRLASREYSMGFGAHMQDDNRMLNGRWWNPGESGFSIEQDLAVHLKLKPGDVLRFDIAGTQIEAPVMNVRSVAWDSFNVNFFVQASPALLQSVPYTAITSIHLKPEQQAVIGQLARDYPAVSAIDISSILDKVKRIIAQGSLAIEGVFLFTLAAAMMVSLATVQISRAQREREISLLRTLGASRRQVLSSLLAEFMLIGLLAGLLAAGLSNLLNTLLAKELFGLNSGLNLSLWLIGPLSGTLLVGLVGYLASRPALATPPLRVLR